MQSPVNWSREALRERLVRYDELAPCTTAFIDTRTPGSEGKENFTIIGPGVAESPDQYVHIREPHGFNIGGARQPPGCVNSQHSHETAEVFVVQAGTWAFRTGEHGRDGEIVLKPGDAISIPTQVFRGFENIGADIGFLFSVLGGNDPGRVTWAPYVFEAAREHGLVLLESGRLVDTAVGERVPDGESVVSPTSAATVAGMRQMSSEQLQEIVVPRSDHRVEATGPLAQNGTIIETPLIGGETADPTGHVTAAGKINWAHGFQLRHLSFTAGSATPRHARTAPEVLFVHRGRLTAHVADSEFRLGPGDVFTIPTEAPRTYSNETGDPCELYMVLGGEAPDIKLDETQPR